MKTALLMIDTQANMFDPAHPVVDSVALLERLRGLLERARSAGVPVFFVRNNGGEDDPDVHGTPGWELHPALAVAPGDPVLDKTTCNTFESTDLAGLLEARGITHLVIAGLQSDWCIRETTLGAAALGYTVTLVSDGHSTYDGKTQNAAETTAAVNEELSACAGRMRADEISFSR